MNFILTGSRIIVNLLLGEPSKYLKMSLLRLMGETHYSFKIFHTYNLHIAETQCNLIFVYFKSDDFIVQNVVLSLFKRTNIILMLINCIRNRTIPIGFIFVPLNELLNFLH